MWHYTLNGETFGPVTEADLDALVQGGTLTPGTLVWREGMTEWQPYQAVRTVAAAPVAGLRIKLDAPMPSAQAAPEVVGGAAPEVGMGSEDEGASSTRNRVEAFTSWGAVALALVGMFIFVGVLASRPARHSDDDFNDPPTRNARRTSEATDGTSPRTLPNRRTLGSAFRTLKADVSLRFGSLTIRNESSFDWPATKVSFDSGGQKYTYDFKQLAQSDSVSISLDKFKDTTGKTFSSGLLTPDPTDFVLSIRGFSPASVHLSKRR